MAVFINAVIRDAKVVKTHETSETSKSTGVNSTGRIKVEDSSEKKNLDFFLKKTKH